MSMGTAEQRIQDVSSLVSDSSATRDLVETTNMKLIDPFFEAIFSLEEEDFWLKEQALVSLIRLLKTHTIESPDVITQNEIGFYSHFEPYIGKVVEILDKPLPESQKEALTQQYLIQLWCEVIQLFVHSHQQTTITQFFEKGVLTSIVKKMEEPCFQKSTVFMKAITRIILELIEMDFSQYVVTILNETKLMETVVTIVVEQKKIELKSFANAIVWELYNAKNKNDAYHKLFENYPQIDNIWESINQYHEDMRKILMTPTQSSPDFGSEDDLDYEYIDDDDDSDEDSDEDDDMTAKMEDFFEEIKNKPEMLEDMEIDSSIPDMKDDPLMPKDLPVFSKKFEHLYDEINRQDNLFV